MTVLLKHSFFIMLSLISISAFIICVFISLESNFINSDEAFVLAFFLYNSTGALIQEIR